MNVTLLLVALVVFAFIVGHVLNRYVSRIVSLSGAEYLLVGALIGPALPPRLVTHESLSQLVPLMSLLLGLTGFLVGLRTRRAVGGWRVSAAGLMTSLATLLLVAIACASLASAILPSTSSPWLSRRLLVTENWIFEIHATGDHVLLGLALAASAVVTSSGLLTSLGQALEARSQTFALLKASATDSQLLAIVTIGVVLALARGEVGYETFGLGGIGWLGGAIVLGLICGGCFTLFIGDEQSSNRIFLATVGTVTFASGVGAALGVSPLFVNLVSGLAVGAIASHRSVLLRELDRLQHPIFVLLLVLTGAMWTPVHGLFWLFPVVYIAARWACNRGLTSLFTWMFTRVRPYRIGDGLMAQGTLAVAIAIDYALKVPQHASIVLTTVLVGTLAFDMVAGGALRRLLVDVEADTINLTSAAEPSIRGQETGL